MVRHRVELVERHILTLDVRGLRPPQFPAASQTLAEAASAVAAHLGVDLAACAEMPPHDDLTPEAKLIISVVVGSGDGNDRARARWVWSPRVVAWSRHFWRRYVAAPVRDR